MAIVIEEDCAELGLERSQIGVASWNDDRRPPLYWIGSDHPTDCGTVLMYECRHFFEDDCEQLPILLAVSEDVLVDARKAYDNILSIIFRAFEHVGPPPNTGKFLDESTIKVTT